ncbi:MAG: hypothetical protein AAGJ46_05620 [Planctomycetota bacterium]
MSTIVAVTGAAANQTYTYTDFTVAGANDTILNSISDNGRVAGIYGDINPAQGLTPGWNGFVSDLDGSNLTTLTPHPDALGVEAAAVNNSGVVVGSFSLPVEGFEGFETFRGFVYDGSEYQVLAAPFPDAIDTIVASVNNQGVVYGSFSETFAGGLVTVSHGFRATPDGMGGYSWEAVSMPDPVAVISNTFLSGGNASGQEILTLRRQYFDLFTGVREDVFSKLTPGDHRIESPNGEASRAASISDSGTIVGVVSTAEQIDAQQFEIQNLGFVVQASDLQTLPPEQVTYMDPNIPGSDNRVMSDELGNVGSTGHAGLNGVNNSGVIVGFYDNEDGIYRGFIGTPDAVSTPGDYNGDGTVDAADYTIWRDTLDSTTDLRADGNGDEMITAADHEVWRLAFEATASAADAAPEPHSGGLLAAAGAFAAWRRRHA